MVGGHQQGNGVDPHQIQPVPLPVPVRLPEPTRLGRLHPLIELGVDLEHDFEVQMSSRLSQTRAGPAENAERISRPHHLPHLGVHRSEVGVDREDRQPAPVVLHDHLLAVVGNPFVVIHPHHHPVRTGAHRIERFSPCIPAQRLDIDSLVEPLEDPRRFRLGGSGEAKHPGDQSSADGGLIKSLGLIFKKVPVLRRQLPRNAIRGRFLLGGCRCSQKNTKPW